MSVAQAGRRNGNTARLCAARRSWSERRFPSQDVASDSTGTGLALVRHCGVTFFTGLAASGVTVSRRRKLP